VDVNPTATAVRERRRIERLGPNPVCPFCGYSNPVGLMRRLRTLLQADHIFGRKRDSETTIVICRNCHAEITEDRMRAGIPMRRERDPVKRVAFMLLGLSVLFAKLAESMQKAAEDLLEECDE
jgi:hypothetical protein